MRPTRAHRLLWITAAVLLAVAAAVATALAVNHRSTTAGRALAAAPVDRSQGAAQSSRPAAKTPHPAGSSSTSAAAGRTVHVSALQSDGDTYGVGMPVVLFFTPAPTDARAFAAAVHVTVDGQPANGAWYWEQPTADEVAAHTVEAHYRLPGYWPADSRIHVSIPVGGLSAGAGLVYSNKLTSLDYKIGDAHISTVDARTLMMHVTSNGRLVNHFPVSLGKAATPTFNGVKVVMQKGEDIPGTNRLRANGTVLMNGPGYTNDPVMWSVRITRSGEYVHAAPWNNGIGQNSTSNGCTNLHTANAKWFYAFSQLGDVVQYSNTDGTAMPSWDGLGDWNVRWSQWSRGGLLAP
jgi:lipoprotein-anchoring transpeptidase ErfK/SrfK